MAKPDLTKTYVSSAGQLMKDDGESSLIPAFTSLKTFADDTAAANGGVTLSGIYINASTGAITVRDV